MQANEAIEKLRKFTAKVSATIADENPERVSKLKLEANSILAATATIDPPAAPVLAAVEVEQQGNAIRPSAEPAGQLDAGELTCDQCIELEGALHREYARQAIAVIRKEAHGLLRYEFRNGIEAACGQMERLLNLNDEQSSTAGAAKGGNTSEQTAIREIRATAAQPAADHAKLIADALELAHDLALEQQAEIAARFEGYKPEKHAAAARDVALAKEALLAWQARGQQAGAAIPGEAK